VAAVAVEQEIMQYLPELVDQVVVAMVVNQLFLVVQRQLIQVQVVVAAVFAVVQHMEWVELVDQGM